MCFDRAFVGIADVRVLGGVAAQHASQFGLAPHAAPRAQQSRQQIELAAGQARVVGAEGDHPAVGIEGDVAVREQLHRCGESVRRCLLLPLEAAGEGIDAGAQFAGTERLGDVVVGTGAQTEDRVDFVGAPGDDEHVRVGCRADAARGFEAVDPGDGDVDGDGVGVAFDDGANALLAVGDRHRLEAGAHEHLRDHGAHVGIVLDDHRGAAVGCRHLSPPPLELMIRTWPHPHPRRG